MALYHNQRFLELFLASVKYIEWMLSFYNVKVIDKKQTKMSIIKYLILIIIQQHTIYWIGYKTVDNVS